MTAGLLTTLGLSSRSSGTGLDVALVETDGMTLARPGVGQFQPYDDDLRARLAAAMADPDRAPPSLLIGLSTDLTDAHAAAAEAFLRRRFLPADRIGVVGFLGHTLAHKPALGITRQIGDGSRLASRIGLTVVDEFRAADVAAGGNGTPLSAVYLAAIAENQEKPLAVLNLCDAATVTYLDDNNLIAFDAGPGPGIVDRWVKRRLSRHRDQSHRSAAVGSVNAAALDALLANPFFALAPPKALDRDKLPLEGLAGLSTEDGAATLSVLVVEAIARSISALPVVPQRWLVSGIGRNDKVLMALLRARLGMRVEPVETVGWSGDLIEAQAAGYLAARSLKGLPLTLPSTTGVALPIRGGVLHRPPADAMEIRDANA